MKTNKYVGTINVPDGLIDITDPCYEDDTWCAMFNKKIKSGKYKCFVTIEDFMFEDMKDRRLTAPKIVHDSLDEAPLNFEVLSDSIGVDAGLCGFYNHKPNFDKDGDWDNFWQSLSKIEKYIDCDCTKANGVTVSSGFGDGMYTVYEAKVNDETVALLLNFGDEKSLKIAKKILYS